MLDGTGKNEMGLFKDLKNLLLGMRITSKHLGRHAITIQYPEQKWTMPERSRGIVVLLSDKKTGELNCTSCMLCMRACPTAAIVIDAPRGEDKKRKLKSFVVDHGLCCFCGLCEESCNFCAIKMATKYEFSSVNKDDMVWDVTKLQEMGRDVEYVDTRKKKPVAKKAKPAESKDVSKENSDTEPANDQKTASKESPAAGAPAANPGDAPGMENPARESEQKKDGEE